eukprot:1248029-Prymnesium_polylepis.1
MSVGSCSWSTCRNASAREACFGLRRRFFLILFFHTIIWPDERVQACSSQPFMPTKLPSNAPCTPARLQGGTCEPTIAFPPAPFSNASRRQCASVDGRRSLHSDRTRRTHAASQRVRRPQRGERRAVQPSRPALVGGLCSLARAALQQSKQPTDCGRRACAQHARALTAALRVCFHAGERGGAAGGAGGRGVAAGAAAAA